MLTYAGVDEMEDGDDACVLISDADQVAAGTRMLTYADVC